MICLAQTKEVYVLPVKCFDLRVLEDRVNLRTTFNVALFSMSDSEFSFFSIFMVTLLAVFSTGGFFSETFLLIGAEAALLSLSDSLKI